MFDKKIEVVNLLDKCLDIIWEMWKKENNEENKTILFNIMEELEKIINNINDEMTNIIMNNKG